MDPSAASTPGHAIKDVRPDTMDMGRLESWMRAHIQDFNGPLTLSKFPGGQSNPTYRLDTPRYAYVLRRKPLGPLLASAHAVEREYRIIKALEPSGFPVPRTYGLCSDETVIGSVFYIMEWIEGRNLCDGSLPGLEPVERTELYHSIIDTLAALHSIDPKAVGLGDYGKAGHYFERQMSRWTRQYRVAQTEHLEEMERLLEWLPRTLPEQERSCIVHGDYRIDNLILAPATPQVRTVLDWELSTLGDPIADLAYLLMNWIEEHQARSSVSGLDLEALGIPSLEAMAARYRQKTGRTSTPPLAWYFSFNLFRLACIVQGIHKRVLQGTASSAHAAQAAQRVPQLARAAWNCAVRAGA